MINHIRDEQGVSLIVLVITVVIMVILAGVSISLLQEPQHAKQELLDYENFMNEFYNNEYQIQNQLSNEIINDYDNLGESSTVESDINLPVSTSTEDWDGYVNKPHLLSDMTAIYFDDAGNEVELTDSSSHSEWNKWYDYSTQKWANAKTSDDSYWVWIPRYAYKITNEINDGIARNISIIFVDNKNRNGSEKFGMEYPEVIDGEMSDYVVHPAFGTDLENGGTNTHKSGFWVAKYEMSMEKSDNGGETWYYADGVDALTKNAGNVNSIRAVSKPGVSSWRNITIGNAYSNSFYYNREGGDSHLMKNSEWGAVAYLTHSVYGRDGVEVSQNTSSTYITGTGSVAASSTGNEYGVYDLVGGAWEFVSAYIVNSTGAEYRSAYGGSFATATKSTEYLTIYPFSSTSDSSNDNWNEYNKYKNTRFGDSVLETSTAGSGYNAWNSDEVVYVHSDRPFLTRSGVYDYAEEPVGIFMFGRASGTGSEKYTFRTVMF